MTSKMGRGPPARRIIRDHPSRLHPSDILNYYRELDIQRQGVLRPDFSALTQAYVEWRMNQGRLDHWQKGGIRYDLKIKKAMIDAILEEFRNNGGQLAPILERRKRRMIPQ